jgi:hypothetical protein
MKGLTKRLPPVNALDWADAREFKGGLNTYDTPLNLSRRFVTELRNLYPDTNGRLRLRYGTTLFSDVSSMLDEIVGIQYFNAALIVVGKNGKIVSINASGVATVRWSFGWSINLTTCCFTQFNGSLIICNGVDKPVTMNQIYTVNFLADAGTAGNVNVPRAKFCATYNNYLIMAVTPTDKTTLYIGAKGTAGTFYGDPGVDNDAVNFITSTYVNIGSPDITGMSIFRDKLIIAFAETVLSLQLGNYSGTPAKHIPAVHDTINSYGCVSNRCIVPIGDDILLCDQTGISSLSRSVITNSLNPVREATLISADIQKAMSGFTPKQLDQYTFAVHDRIAQQVMFFVPKSTTVEQTTDNNVYVFCFDKSQKLRAWSYYDQMAYRCGTRTTEGRVFLTQGTKVYYYRNQYEPVYSDYVLPGSQPWNDSTNWNDNTGWQEISTGVGVPIPYAFTTPWTDLRKPGNLKQSKYLNVLAEGDGLFTVEMFVDRFSAAELSAQFVVSDDPRSYQYYYTDKAVTDIAHALNAGTRPATTAQLYAWPHKFDLMRLRASGTAISYIAFVALQVAYLGGSIRR